VTPGVGREGARAAVRGELDGMTGSRSDDFRPRASELTGRNWLNTGGRTLSLEDLAGKVVVLDFWAFCCVNCLHVIEEMRPIEEKWHDEMVVVGVHSPKFSFEADPEALAANVARYDVRHPVLDDPALRTWDAYAVRAWPTLVVLDTHGRIAGTMSGEGHGAAIDALVERLVAEGEADGSLRRGDSPFVAADEHDAPLRFPAGAVALPDGRVAVADTGHHRVVVLAEDLVTVDEVVGTGDLGRADGHGAEASFNAPNGLAIVPDELVDVLDADLVVADTGNHLLRGVRLSRARTLLPDSRARVRTLAGTGRPWTRASGTPETGRDPRAVDMSTPWDVEWSAVLRRFVVAMAGVHQLWAYDPADDALTVLGGTTNEGLVDGPLVSAWFAQTSGLDEGPDGRLWIADSETSALRVVDPAEGTVATAVGTGLFDFGHRDGPADEALLQHPLAVAAAPDGTVLVADTYNGALRRYDPAAGEVVTLAENLAEPSGLLVVGDDAIVVESSAHRLVRVPLGTEPTRVGGELQRTKRPATDLAPGPIALRVVFTPPPGQKLDESLGPSTELLVSATPTLVLEAGAGKSVELERDIVLAEPPAWMVAEERELVLHVAARAASCDADPTVEWPVCHLHQQDWGIPVRIVEGGATELVLTLQG
jgi:thiol-disulfide isomerase/thioredoxin